MKKLIKVIADVIKAMGKGFANSHAESAVRK